MSAHQIAADAGVSGRSALKKPFAWMIGRLRGRADTEHEMSANRLVFALLIVIYLAIYGGQTQALAAMGAYFALAFGNLAHIIYAPASNNARRAFALFLDLGFLSWQMHLGDEPTAVLFPIYLWVVFGNGFRFGLTWLRLSMLTAIGTFASVVLTTEFWADNQSLSIGLLIGLLILPLYAGTLIRRLEQARLVAEQASRAKTMFLASVSHELRTPLNAIIGTSALLQGHESTAPQREMAHTIDTAAKSLLGLIDSILDYSRIEAGKVAIQITEFDLLDMLAEVRSIIGVQAEEKGLRLSFHIAANTPLRISGERRRMQEILLNLAGNALKFTLHGSIAITVRLDDDGSRLRFRVTDTGIGISADKHQHIFDSFSQADETIINRFGGTGLGLAICKSLAEAMGGAIGVDSAPGMGSTFWFTVRAEPVAEVSAAAGTDTDILVISEDDALNDLLCAAIPGGRKHVLVARGLKQAATLLAEGEEIHQPVVLVDARLEGEPGRAAALLRDAAASGVALVLIGDLDGAADAKLAHDYVTVLGRVPVAAEIAGALRIASFALDRRPDDVSEDEFVVHTARRVLVADDNLVNRKVLQKLLERAGHTVRTVCNGEEVLDALDTADYDVVLMDMNMPVMDGIEATKMYRMTTLGEHRAAIIGLTADATREAEERCLDAGMDACLTKPIEPRRLLDRIEEVALQSEDRNAAVPPAYQPKVTEIASHPRFRHADAAEEDVVAPGERDQALAVDPRVLASLAALGGSEFLDDLASTFMTTADTLLGDLRNAVVANDDVRFRAAMHALASAGANLGTTRLVELCRSAQRDRQQELADIGRLQLERVSTEVQRVRVAFKSHAHG